MDGLSNVAGATSASMSIVWPLSNVWAWWWLVFAVPNYVDVYADHYNFNDGGDVVKAFIVIALLAMLSVFLALPAVAGPKCSHEFSRYANEACDCWTGNPDRYTSVLVRFGGGNLDGSFGNANATVTKGGVELIHPLDRAFSLIAKWDYVDVDWESPVSWRDVDGNTVEFGLKFYIR